MCGKTIIEAQDMDRNHSAKICARGTGLRKRSHGCAEGALIEPHPAVKRLGRPRETEFREVFDRILYPARTGCQCRRGFRHLFATASPMAQSAGGPGQVRQLDRRDRQTRRGRCGLCLAQSKLLPGKGFRGIDREQSVGLHHLCAAAHQAISLTLT